MGYRRTCCRGCQVNKSAATFLAEQAPMGTPLPRPLAKVIHVRHDALVLEGKPGAGAADAGLDFIEHQVLQWCCVR